MVSPESTRSRACDGRFATTTTTKQTGILISLNYLANNRVYFLRNFYDKSKRSILKARVEGPAAYVFSANDPRPGSQAELLRVLQRQAVEISRATAAFTVKVPVRPAPAGGRGTGCHGCHGCHGCRGCHGCHGWPRVPAGCSECPECIVGANPENAEAAAEASPQAAQQQPPRPRETTREFPAGSYIVRMDQPYSRIADALLDYQYWAPNDPQTRPYDDTGWTFPEGFGCRPYVSPTPRC